MGSQQSTVVSVVAEGEQESPFATRRHPECKKGISSNPPDVQTMRQFALKYFNQYLDKPYLGARQIISPSEPSKYGPEFVWRTYGESLQIAKNYGAGLWQEGITKGSMYGIYAENCYEWIHTIDASSLYGFVIASLYDSLGPDSLVYIMKHSKMEAILVSAKNVKKLINLIKEDLNTDNADDDKLSLRMLILTANSGTSLLDYANSELNSFNIVAKSFEDVCKLGESNPRDYPEIDPEDPHFICYSSGTTGRPKGVIISNRAQISTAFGATHEIPLGENPRHLSYLPLAHIFERSAISISMMAGGCIGFISGGVSNLTSDMAILKPTFLAAVPRVMNRFYDNITNKLKVSSVKRALFWGAWYARRFCIRTGLPAGPINAVFAEIPRIMGGSIQQVIVGGAAMDPNIQEFLQVAMGVPIRAGYGLTEAGSGNIISPINIRYVKPGTVGGPLVNCEIKLDPIDGYNDPECGEIIVTGQCVASGYLHDQTSSSELFYNGRTDSIRTGDVGKWDEDGYMMVVDRLRSIFKLSQGEYVAAELVTQVFEEAELVNQIFVYGDSTRTCLVAVVVPDKKATAKFLRKERVTDDEFKNVCNQKEFKDEILTQLSDVAKKHKLFGYQFVRAVHCDPEEWTVDNEYLTPTFKLKRKKLSDRYKAEIQKLYNSLDSPK
ncbi:AMP-binding enzyme family protein [Tritrichomonas foetus]|uniref:AMP-binding enzyme family protein n=1 Tax=Tritrichomonas foetus TaxID=1144522 RepID=A0A1J4JPU7_9EUKA|nr:AMP-binding enzyme family protein [Tritrichomonas foetus]|eukprot:OHS99547.1 AMP-binding enzyme family protein [Tritrichomonas foetus]